MSERITITDEQLDEWERWPPGLFGDIRKLIAALRAERARSQTLRRALTEAVELVADLRSYCREGWMEGKYGADWDEETARLHAALKDTAP